MAVLSHVIIKKNKDLREITSFRASRGWQLPTAEMTEREGGSCFGSKEESIRQNSDSEERWISDSGEMNFGFWGWGHILIPGTREGVREEHFYLQKQKIFLAASKLQVKHQIIGTFTFYWRCQEIRMVRKKSEEMTWSGIAFWDEVTWRKVH